MIMLSQPCVFHAEIVSMQKLAKAKMYVIKGSCGSLLSCKTACNLGLMKINVNAYEGSNLHRYAQGYYCHIATSCIL